MTDMALPILLGSSLCYVGLGAQQSAAERGVLIGKGRNFLMSVPLRSALKLVKWVSALYCSQP